VSGGLLEALYACGAQQEAVELALTKLEKTAECHESGIIEFLGTTNDTSVLPVIEDFTREDVIDAYSQDSWNSHDALRLQRSGVGGVLLSTSGCPDALNPCCVAS